jgi:phosphatidylglycerophosphate synthase
LFGAANTITLSRILIASLIAIFSILEILRLDVMPQGSMAAGIWLFFVLAVLAFLTDGLDGYVARRLGQVSESGARLDMEADTALIWATSLFLIAFDRAGIWVLIAGLWRPAFLFMQLIRPALKRPLFESFWRKFVCAIVVGLLVAAMMPFITTAQSNSLAALAVALVSLSFLRDIIWLARQA